MTNLRLGLNLLVPATCLMLLPGVAHADLGEAAEHPALVGRGTVGLACTLAAFLVGIGFHEWAHAWTAVRLGDPTPEQDGRLSLNPLDHLDPLGSVLLILGTISSLPIIGWGRAVSVVPSNFRNQKDGMMKVALAGPLMNFFIVGVCGVVIRAILLVRDLELAWLPDGLLMNFGVLFITTAFLNLSLGVFNLIPIPPLDGAKVMAGYLPEAGAEFLHDLGSRSIILLYFILRSHVLDGPFLMLDFGLAALLRSSVLSLGFFSLVCIACVMFIREVRSEATPVR